MAELVFRVFALATGSYGQLLQPLGYIVTRADFVLDLTAFDRRRRLTMDVSLRLTRDDTCVFLWLWRPQEGVRLMGEPMCSSRGHALVGHTPYVVKRENADRLLCVYIGDGHRRGYTTSVRLNLVSQHPNSTLPDNLDYTPAPNTGRVRLQACLPRGTFSEYREAVYEVASRGVPRRPDSWKAAVGDHLD